MLAATRLLDLRFSSKLDHQGALYEMYTPQSGHSRPPRYPVCRMRWPILLDQHTKKDSSNDNRDSGVSWACNALWPLIYWCSSVVNSDSLNFSNSSRNCTYRCERHTASERSIEIEGRTHVRCRIERMRHNTGRHDDGASACFATSC